MAQASNAPSIVYLMTKEFPSEFESEYCARNQSPKQNTAAEKVMVTGDDRRQRVTVGDCTHNTSLDIWCHDLNKCSYPGIGLLRMDFNGAPFIGTASIICRGACVLTCAHNVVEYDEITKKFVYPTSVWFELRGNKPEGGSVLVKRYKVTKIAVYPPYFENPTSASGSDLALCWIHAEDDYAVRELYSKYFYDMPIIIGCGYSTSTVAVVGFPGERAGEKWGMVGAVPQNEGEDWSFPFVHEWDTGNMKDVKEMLVYDFVDTSPGQSGSPIMGVRPADILGVHTGGSASLKKNWATYITPTKFNWIRESLGSSGEFVTDLYTWYLC